VCHFYHSIYLFYGGFLYKLTRKIYYYQIILIEYYNNFPPCSRAILLDLPLLKLKLKLDVEPMIILAEYEDSWRKSRFREITLKRLTKSGIT
jgi:hypothetical protein